MYKDSVSKLKKSKRKASHLRWKVMDYTWDYSNYLNYYRNLTVKRHKPTKAKRTQKDSKRQEMSAKLGKVK